MLNSYCFNFIKITAKWKLLQSSSNYNIQLFAISSMHKNELKSLWFNSWKRIQHWRQNTQNYKQTRLLLRWTRLNHADVTACSRSFGKSNYNAWHNLPLKLAKLPLILAVILVSSKLRLLIFWKFNIAGNFLEVTRNIGYSLETPIYS